MSPDRVALSCSMALADVPRDLAPGRAHELGFTALEYWWPFDVADPPRAEVDAFVGAVEAAGTYVTCLNFWPGGDDVGGRGLVAVPGHEEEVDDVARRAVELGRRVGVRVYNPMIGLVPGPWGPTTEAFQTAVANLRSAARRVADADAVLAVEPLSGFADYPLRTLADAAELVRAVRADGTEAVGVLADLYHLHVNGDDVPQAVEAFTPLVAHVQVADAPGRGWPGSGGLPLGDWVRDLVAHGYRGCVGLECSLDGRAANPSGLPDARVVATWLEAG